MYALHVLQVIIVPHTLITLTAGHDIVPHTLTISILAHSIYTTSSIITFPTGTTVFPLFAAGIASESAPLAMR